MCESEICILVPGTMPLRALSAMNCFVLISILALFTSANGSNLRKYGTKLNHGMPNGMIQVISIPFKLRLFSDTLSKTE